MFGIGFFELLVIAVVALIFVGPKKLPEVMKQAGRFFVQVRRTANDVRSTFDQIVHDAEAEIRREEAETLRAMLEGTTAKPVKPLAPGSTSGTGSEATTNAASDVRYHDDHHTDGHHGDDDHSGNDHGDDHPGGARPYNPGASIDSMTPATDATSSKSTSDPGDKN